MTKAQASPELLWPYPLIWFADHWMQDCRKFAARVSTASTASEVAEAEASLGERYARDAMAAWADLWLIPLQVMSAATKASKPAR